MTPPPISTTHRIVASPSLAASNLSLSPAGTVLGPLVHRQGHRARRGNARFGRGEGDGDGRRASIFENVLYGGTVHPVEVVRACIPGTVFDLNPEFLVGHRYFSFPPPNQAVSPPEERI